MISYSHCIVHTCVYQIYPHLLLLTCIFLVSVCRLSSERLLLPLQKNVSYQSATAALPSHNNPAYNRRKDVHTAAVPSHNNPAYNARGDVHTYEYITVGGMAVKGIEQHPPELPPDRNIEVQDANNESKG